MGSFVCQRHRALTHRAEKAGPEVWQKNLAIVTRRHTNTRLEGQTARVCVCGRERGVVFHAVCFLHAFCGRVEMRGQTCTHGGGVFAHFKR